MFAPFSSLPPLAQAAGPGLHPLVVILLVVLAGLCLWAVLAGWRDIAGLSLRRLSAVAGHTFRESIRRRVLLLVPLTMAVVIAFGVFQRSISQIDAIRQSTDVCIRTSSALTLILMILLSAFAFPREIESRTIFTLLAKPVSRLEVLLGKVAGLSLVAFLVLALMGSFTYVYLHVRAGRLIDQARATLARQQAAYDRSSSGPSADSAPDAAGAPAVSAVRREPPDAALAQLTDMGLLAALNFIDSADPLDIRPVPPAIPDATAWRWMISGRGYLPLYAIDIPPQGERDRTWQVDLDLLRPGADTGPAARLRVRMQFFAADVPQADADIQLAPAPRAVFRAGWPLAVGPPALIELEPGREGRWHGRVFFPGAWFDRLGPQSRLAVSLVPLDTDPAGELIGLRPDSLMVRVLAPPDPLRSGERLGPPIEIAPRDFQLFPRSQAWRNWPLSGIPAGAPVENAVYRFSNLDGADLPDGPLVVRLKFEVQKGSRQAAPSRARVTAVSRTGQRLDLTAWPDLRRGGYLHVPRELAAGGEVTLLVRPEQPEDLFGLADDSVQLLAMPTGFGANLLKSLTIAAVQAVVVVAVGVSASVFLSWPVALLLTAMVVIAGNLLDFVRAMMATHQMRIFEETGSAVASLAGWAANEMLVQTGRLVQYVVPDFTRFAPADHISQGLNIPLSDLGGDLLWAAGYTLIAVLIGYLALRHKEVAR